MCYSFACYCKDKVILEISLLFVGYENIIFLILLQLPNAQSCYCLHT